MIGRIGVASTGLLLALAQALSAAAQPAAAPHAPLRAAAFARIGDAIIGAADYDAAFAAAQRRRFYHAKVPDAQLDRLRREVGDELINRVLLLQEVRRRHIEADGPSVQAQLDEYEKRYAASPQWPRIKTEMLPALKAELERRSALARIESRIRAVAPPPEEALRDYYLKHPEAFTEPEQVKVSVILLKVDPSAARPAWDGARAEAAAIHARLARGAEFAELARLHSADESAARGGDMGYLHRGMLPEAVQAEVDSLAPGAVSKPLTTLDGVALLRVDDRKAARLRDFASVRERALQLWTREQGEHAWQAFLAALKAKADIEILDHSRYPALTSLGDAGKAAQ